MDSTSVNCKGIILRKLSGAVLYSILAQVVILFAFLFMTNIDLLDPLEWFKNVFQVALSINTWLYTFLLVCIVFVQSIVCGKDYVAEPIYNASKFRRFILHLSVRNIALLLLYMSSGFLNVWLYLSLSEGRYGVLYVYNEKGYLCLEEKNLFVVLSGFWIGFFFFITCWTREKFLQFPVLQQRKLVQFKTNFFPLFEESRKMATWPAISYFFFCFFFNSIIHQTISNMLNVIYEPTRLSVTCYIYVWLFTIAYFFSMNLMILFFKLFLTETIQFPLEERSETSVSLSAAIAYNSLPIIQHLACLDLYLLSIWSVSRRKVLFSLSQPGEHPHYWNNVFASSLKVISQYTKSLNNSLNLILEPPKKEEAVEKKTPLTIQPQNQVEQNKIVISPFKNIPSANVVVYPYSITNISGHKQSTDETCSSHSKYRNMRNMTLINTEPSTETVQATYLFPKTVLKQIQLYMQMKAKLIGFMSKLREVFAFHFIFDETSEANVHSLLTSGQPIVWLIQALSHLAVAAFSEDTYGVVQKDLHILLITLLELREGTEKLHRLLMLNKKDCAFKERSVRMKHNINSAVKRCLYRICLTYNDCIDDLPLNQNALLQLQHYRQTDESSRFVSGYYKNTLSEGFM